MTARAPKSITNFRLNLDKVDKLERGTPDLTDLVPYFDDAAGYAKATTPEGLSTGTQTPTGITTTPYTLSTAQSSQVFYNNSGALLEFLLPAAAIGLVYSFFVNDYNGTKITANGTDCIRIAPTGRGASGGYIESTTVGSFITLRGIAASFLVGGTPTAATEWEATVVTGNWDMDV